ncbi:hypothetical protein NSP74_24570, partial [Salmonella enterica]|nr:hypothetical protein [Salmonella enterica]
AAAHRQRYGALAALPAPGADDDDAAPITDFPREADWNGMPEADFRRLARGFFRAHYPEHLRHVPWRLHWDEIKDWY